MSGERVKFTSNMKPEYFRCILGGALALAIFAPLDSASAAHFQVLHSFAGAGEGANSFAGLIMDAAGNFYGTASEGGGNGCDGFGCGTVFKMAPDGTETVLYTFTGGADGAIPYGDLIQDKAGYFYSTTQGGGTFGKGTVFKLAADGTETVLYSFTGGNDGADPRAGLVADNAGNLYGTAGFGGTGGGGVVFKLAPGGTETVLYSFCMQQNCADGSRPYAGLIQDRAGNLYSTTYSGGGTGCNGSGCGTVYEVAANGTETVLYSFQGGNDGQFPSAFLIKDRAGNFYSTTAGGGTSGFGTVFKLAPGGTETVLYSFQGGSDGAGPYAALKMDRLGNLYGTTTSRGGACNCGTVFKLAPSGTETTLHSFSGSDGAGPAARLTLHDGRFYSTTAYGGAYGYGTVFSVRK